MTKTVNLKIYFEILDIEIYTYDIIRIALYVWRRCVTVRKNFLLDDEIAKHLEEIAKKEKTTQSEIIRRLIEEKYQEYLKLERLKAFKTIIPVEPGTLVGKSIQSIKEEMGQDI